MASKTSKSPKSAKPTLVAVSNDDTIIAAAEMDPAIMDDASDAANAARPDAYKMKDLLAAVVTKTGAKKKDAKDVVDAALAEIAAALTAGKALSLPPLGNLRVAKTMEKGGTAMMVLRLRMGGGTSGEGKANGAKDALADDSDDS